MICHDYDRSQKMVYTDVEIQLAIDNTYSQAEFASLSPKQRDSVTRFVSGSAVFV